MCGHVWLPVRWEVVELEEKRIFAQYGTFNDHSVLFLYPEADVGDVLSNTNKRVPIKKERKGHIVMVAQA